MPFGLAGGALGAVGGIVGAGKQADATKQAAQTQANAANHATDIQAQQFQQEQANQKPWLQAGTGALGALTSMMGVQPAAQAGQSVQAQPMSYDDWAKQQAAGSGLNPSGSNGLLGGIYGNLLHQTYDGLAAQGRLPTTSTPGAVSPVQGGTTATGSLLQGFDPTSAGLPSKFSYSAADMQNDPGYQFAMQQGQQAIQRSAAAQGNALGGGTLKALDQYSQGVANQAYNTDYNRAQNTYQQNYSNAFNTFGTNQSNAFNRLASVAGIGQTANNQLSAAGQNYANQASGNALAAGNAASAGIIGASNAQAQGWGNALGSFGNALSNPSVSSYLSNTFHGSGGKNAGGITDSNGSYLGE